jgi:hypothetical protein
LLFHQASYLIAHPDDAKKIAPLMFWGPPGIGKSDIVRSVAVELKVPVIDIRLSQREPVDMRGLPVPTEDGVKWLVSNEFPRDPDWAGIIFFDELSAADPRVQVAAYEFILDRRLGDLYTVPRRAYIAGAGNRSQDRAVATRMSSALAARFMHLDVEADPQVWARWAVAAGIHPDVIGFIRFRPALLFSMEGNLERGWANPRAWERVSHQLRLAEVQQLDVRGRDLQTEGAFTLLELQLQGLVGPGAAAEFNAFRFWSHQLPDVLKMMRGEEPIKIPDRADQKYAMASAMVYHLNHRVGAAVDDQKLLGGFLRIGTRFTSDFAIAAMWDALYAGGRDEFSDRTLKIMKHPDFAAWFKAHEAGFQKNGVNPFARGAA